LVKTIGRDVHVHQEVVETIRNYDPNLPVFFAGIGYKAEMRKAKKEGEWWVMPDVARKFAVLFQRIEHSQHQYPESEVNYALLENFLGIPGIVITSTGPCIYAWR
jgi:hypothetical protein